MSRSARELARLQPSLGQRIQYLREERCIDAEHFCNAVSISRSTLYRWESGEVTPHPVNIKAIAKTLDVTIEELVGATAADYLTGVYAHLSGNLPALRKRLGFTRRQLAVASRVPTHRIVDYEASAQGTIVPRSHLERMAQVLGVTLDALIQSAPVVTDEERGKYLRQISAIIAELNNVGLQVAVERLSEISKLKCYTVCAGEVQ